MSNNADGTFTGIIGSTGINVGHLGAWNCDAGRIETGESVIHVEIIGGCRFEKTESISN